MIYTFSSHIHGLHVICARSRLYRMTSPEALVSCDWLKQQLEVGLPDNVVILDVSWSSSKDCYEDYKREHIPGARYINVMNGDHTELFPRNLPNPESFQQAAREAGLNQNSQIILYSSSDLSGFFLSGRAWWTFQCLGASNVSILDGGLQKWREIDGRLTSDVTEIKPGDFTVARRTDIYKSHDDLVGLLNKRPDSIQIGDTRPLQAYTDRGHIPSAKNVPASSLVDGKTGQLKSISEIKSAFKEANIDLDRPLVTHCNSGMSSCTVAFAARLCGNKEVAVYHGGFTEWTKLSPDQLEK